jgi:hypothetical protein
MSIARLHAIEAGVLARTESSSLAWLPLPATHPGHDLDRLLHFLDRGTIL